MFQSGDTHHSFSLKTMAVWFFVVALFVRLLVLWGLIAHGGPFDGLVFGDGTRYYALAEAMVQQGVYVYEDGIESYRPPGYPTYIALFLFFGLPVWVAVIVQIIVAACIPVGMLYVAKVYFRFPIWVAALAGALAALEPVQVFYSVTVTPDVFFAACVLGALYFLVRYTSTAQGSQLVFSGLLLGVANYFRPAGVYMSIFLLIGLLYVLWRTGSWPKQLVVHLSLFIGGMSLIMFPWMMRNYYTFNEFAFSSSDGYLVYVYSAAQSIAVAEGRSYNEVKAELLQRLEEQAPDGKNRTSLKNRAWLLAQSKQIIFSHPVEYIKGVALGVNTVFFSGNYHYLLMRYGLIDRPERVVSYSLTLSSRGVVGLVREVASQITEPYVLIAIFGKLFWIVAVAGALCGAWVLRRDPLSIIFVTLVVYFACTTFATTIGVEARHRYTLNPLIFLFVSAVIYLLYEKVIRRRSAF